MELLTFTEALTLGQRVRLLRIARRWRQVDLAAIAGVEQFELSRLELDRRVRPNVLKAVSEVLGLDAAYE
jgi:transcriptional regulator with XRE-family HTH domain